MVLEQPPPPPPGGAAVTATDIRTASGVQQQHMVQSSPVQSCPMSPRPGGEQQQQMAAARLRMMAPGGAAQMMSPMAPGQQAFYRGGAPMRMPAEQGMPRHPGEGFGDMTRPPHPQPGMFPGAAQPEAPMMRQGFMDEQVLFKYI